MTLLPAGRKSVPHPGPVGCSPHELAWLLKAWDEGMLNNEEKWGSAQRQHYERRKKQWMDANPNAKPDLRPQRERMRDAS